jgi:outer membrane murein-binding lipoprotein Lpp
MDLGTAKDFIADLMIKIEDLEVRFRTLNAVIEQLQKERDNYRSLWLEAEAKRHD